MLKYLFERKYSNILKRDSKNKYAIENRDLKPFTWVIQRVFIVLIP
jgi:hypothetical protein